MPMTSAPGETAAQLLDRLERVKNWRICSMARGPCLALRREERRRMKAGARPPGRCGDDWVGWSSKMGS